jgi:hypothetical protein
MLHHAANAGLQPREPCHDNTVWRIEAWLATAVGIGHWSGAISEIGRGCCRCPKASQVRNLCGLATLDASTWVAGDGRRLLRYEVGGLRLAVYKRDYNSTQMANLQPHPPKFSHLLPSHCALPAALSPKSQVPVSLFYERPQPPYPVNLLPCSFFSHNMSSASFRLESFWPWNPFQDKAQPPRDSLDICRYLSPISITATLPPSNSSNLVLKSQKVHSYNSERYPIPTRPLVEVCFDSGLHSDSQTTRREPEELGRITSADIYIGAFDSKEILQSQDLLVPKNVNSIKMSGYIYPGAKHQFRSVNSGDLEPTIITSQRP